MNVNETIKMHDRWSTGSSSIKSWHNHRQCAQTTRRSSAGLPSSKSSQSMESIRVDPQIWYIRDHETWIWAALLWNAWASKGTWGVGPQSTLELQKPGVSPLQKCILPIRFLRFLSLKHQGLWQVHRTIVSQDGVDLFGDDSYTCMIQKPSRIEWRPLSYSTTNNTSWDASSQICPTLLHGH